MKELETHQTTISEVKAEAPIKKQAEHLLTLKPHKGHTCFEINVVTGEICEANIESSNKRYQISGPGKGFVKKKIMVKDNCIYLTALNKENALKKYKKLKQWRHEETH